jgi:pyroglutamyl-peptidase
VIPVAVVLLTGFEPFGGQAVNPSWQAVQLLASRWDGPAELVTLELPVDFRAAGPALAEAIAGRGRRRRAGRWPP